MLPNFVIGEKFKQLFKFVRLYVKFKVFRKKKKGNLVKLGANIYESNYRTNIYNLQNIIVKYL